MTRKTNPPKEAVPRTYEPPLTFNDIIKCVDDGKLTARVKFPENDVYDRDHLDQAIAHAFPGFTLSDVDARYVGCESGDYDDPSLITFDIIATVVKYIDPARGLLPGKVYTAPLKAHDRQACARNGVVTATVRVSLASLLTLDRNGLVGRWLGLDLAQWDVSASEITVVGHEDFPDDGNKSAVSGFVLLHLKANVKPEE